MDCSPPFDADSCEYLHDALVNFFSLVTHLSGPCRTPFFGLFALTKFVEVSPLYLFFEFFICIAKSFMIYTDSHNVITNNLKCCTYISYFPDEDLPIFNLNFVSF